MVRVVREVMEGFTGGIYGIHVNYCLGEMRHLLREPVAHFGSDRMAFLH